MSDTSSTSAEVDWKRAQQHLQGCLRRHLGGGTGREEIADLTQEAFLRYLRARRREAPRDAFALLTTIAQRTAADWVRRRQRWALLVQPATDDEVTQTPARGPAAHDLGDPDERVRFLVLEFFRSRRAECVELAHAYFRRHDWRSVANELHLTYESVRQRWSRCVRSLRQAVGDDAHASLLAEWARE